MGLQVFKIVFLIAVVVLVGFIVFNSIKSIIKSFKKLKERKNSSVDNNKSSEDKEI